MVNTSQIAWRYRILINRWGVGEKMLEPNQQPIFKKLTSKLNKLAQIIRPDSEYLSTRCGIAARSDMIQIVKLTRRVKETPNNIINSKSGKAGKLDTSWSSEYLIQTLWKCASKRRSHNHANQ